MQVVEKAVGAPFNMVILNAFLLNKHFGLQKNLTQPEFRYLLAAALLDYTPLVDPPDANCMPQQ